MEFEYYNDKIEKICTDPMELNKKLGKALARPLWKRLTELQAAETFGIFLKLGIGKPHPLSGNLDKMYGIIITANYRLIIKPVVSKFEEQEILACKKIILRGVCDYHGNKIDWKLP